MNKMEEVAKLIGKKLGEEFYIKDSLFKYTLTYAGLKYHSNYRWNLCKATTLRELLTGEMKIEWIPKNGEWVWTIISTVKNPSLLEFHADFSGDILSFKRGLIFRTEEEAIDKMKELGWL